MPAPIEPEYYMIIIRVTILQFLPSVKIENIFSLKLFCIKMTALSGRVLVHVLPFLSFTDLVRSTRVSRLFFHVVCTMRKHICVSVCLHYTPWKTLWKRDGRLHVFTNYINVRSLLGMRIVSFKCSYKTSPLRFIPSFPLYISCVHLNHVTICSEDLLLLRLLPLQDLRFYHVQTIDQYDFHPTLTAVLARCSQLKILKIVQSNCSCTPSLFKRIWLLCPLLVTLYTSTVWGSKTLYHLIDWINEQLAFKPQFRRCIRFHLPTRRSNIQVTLIYANRIEDDHLIHYISVQPSQLQRVCPVYQVLTETIWKATALTFRYRISNNKKSDLLHKVGYTWKQAAGS